MRCLSCNVILTDRESSRKGTFSGEYLDLCDRCIRTIPDLEYVENPSLSDKPVLDEEVTVSEEDEDVVD